MAKGDIKNKQKEPTFVEVVIVGSSLSGLKAAVDLQAQNPATQILVLESEDRGGGRFYSGLHLVSEVGARKWGLTTNSKEFLPLKVRWDRVWTDPDQVDWGHKEFVATLPQWKPLSEKGLRVFEGATESSVGVAVKYKSPVKSIKKLSDSSKGYWELETPTSTYLAKNVVWAAGMLAFQNAFGKHESQTYLEANPNYSQIAADFRSGLALNWEFSEDLVFEDGFPVDHIWSLPLRHEGELFLLVGALIEKTINSQKVYEIKSFVHVENDSLSDPKIISTLQKSIKRTLKNIIVQGSEQKESWVVSSRIFGAEMGTPWLLGNYPAEGLEFVGEETLAAAKSGMYGILGALESVSSLSGLLQTKSVPVAETSEVPASETEKEPALNE